MPSALDMAARHAHTDADVWSSLLFNANVGGENVHRGAVLGALLGAHAGVAGLPPALIDGLAAKNELTVEIDAFVAAVSQ